MHPKTLILETRRGSIAYARLTPREFAELYRQHAGTPGLARHLLFRCAKRANPAITYKQFAKVTLALSNRQLRRLISLFPVEVFRGN